MTKFEASRGGDPRRRGILRRRVDDERNEEVRHSQRPSVAELAQKVRLLEIQTRHLVNDVFSGEYSSVFKGRGVEFSEVREYQPGDDVRTIDWNVTARRGAPFVKRFVEERELTVILAVDGSASTRFGTQGQLKRERAAEIAAVLGLAASRNNDRAGALLFAEGVERYVPPRKGKTHVLRLVRDILMFDPPARGTDLAAAAEFLMRVLHRRSVIFLLSDFLDEGYERPLRALATRHDVVALALEDRRDRELPDIGLIEVVEPESGARRWLDTGSARVRQAYEEAAARAAAARAGVFQRAGVDAVPIDTLADYVDPLRRFFEMRERTRLRRRGAPVSRRSGRALRGARTALLAAVAFLGLPAPARAQAGDAPADPRAQGVVIRIVPEARAATTGVGDEVTVGDPFWVAVRTQGPAGYRLLPQSLIDAYAARPELAVVGSERAGDELRLQIALFRPGDVVLPAVEARVVTARGDTALVPVRADTMRVASVLAPGDTVLADIKPPWKPAPIPWWWWAAALAGAALAAWLLWRRLRQRPAEEAPAVPPRDAYLEARRRIAALGAEPSDADAAILAAGGIGDALREYLAEAWRIPARERTTFELLGVLPARVAGERPAVGGILVAADLAKFARVAPERREIPPLASRAIAVLDRLEEARKTGEPEPRATRHTGVSPRQEAAS